jgi:hypothetical protein
VRRTITRSSMTWFAPSSGLPLPACQLAGKQRDRSIAFGDERVSSWHVRFWAVDGRAPIGVPLRTMTQSRHSPARPEPNRPRICNVVTHRNFSIPQHHRRLALRRQQNGVFPRRHARPTASLLDANPFASAVVANIAGRILATNSEMAHPDVQVPRSFVERRIVASKSTVIYRWPITIAVAIGGVIAASWQFGSFSSQIIGLFIGALVGFVINSRRHGITASMAWRLLAAGYPISVWSRSPDKLAVVKCRRLPGIRAP